jgi:hypothetical protein
MTLQTDLVINEGLTISGKEYEHLKSLIIKRSNCLHQGFDAKK